MAAFPVVTPNNLGNEFDLGVIEANKIHVKIGNSLTRSGTGVLNVVPDTVAYNNATKILTHTNALGATTNIDLSGLAADIFVNGGSFNAATSVLTLTDNSGTTPDVTINLAALLGVSSDAGNVLTAGADGKGKLTAAAIATAAAGGATEQVTDAFGVNLFKAYP